MKTKFFLTIFLSIFAVLSISAQVFVKVDESAIKASFENNQLRTNFPVEISAASANVKVKLEVLDAQDNPAAIGETSQILKRGRHNLPILLSFGKQENADELLWKRLRYTVLTENPDVSITNILALSEIMPEIFELQVSAPAQIFAGMNFRVHILALHPITRQPIKNVEISGNLELELDTDNDNDELSIKAKGKTNDEGFVSLDFKIPANLKIEDGDIQIKGEKNGIVREADDYLDVSANAFLYLTTDKPIYQPAQKLFVRGLFLDSQKRPLAEQELDFEISGEDGETVYEGTAKTSRFGVINVEWQIPADIKLGSYEIEFDNDDDEDWKAEFKISRYDLPNFAVNAKSAKPFYLADENSAEITVNAAYLFGKPVTKGKVKIVREKERRWNYEEQEYETSEGETITGETDADGKFTARMSLAEAQEILKNEKWKRFADVKFAAYFTDSTTNRTEQKRFDIRISKEPIHVYFIRQAADPNPKVPFLFYVSAFYADGTPVKADLKIEGNYRDTTLTNKIAEAKTNSYGASKFEVIFPEKPFSEAKNEFNFRITADDRQGNRGTLEENLYISENSKQLRVQTDKTIYLPNQPVNIKIISSENEQTVFVDVLKNSSVVYSKRVKIENNRGSLFIPFRPDFQGEITISAHSRVLIDDDFENISASKTILFPQSASFGLNVKSLKPTYRPNEEARISFDVRSGEETAVGLLVLDKAIEERARAENLPDNFKAIRRLIGTGEVFGNLTRRDLDNLDLTKPISDDLQLAAEFLLVPKNFRSNFFESDSFENDFSRIYKDYFDKKLEKFTEVLRENYKKTNEFPQDENDLRRILAANGINFDDLRDAWEMPFQANFAINRAEAILTLKTASADKKFGTGDDFTVKEMRFEWFRKTQEQLNVILNNYVQQNGKPPQNEEELKTIWKESGFDFDNLRDGWNRPLYLIKQEYERIIQKFWQETVGNLDGETQQVSRNALVSQKVLVFKIRSKGADGIQGVYDDFEVGSFTVVLAEKNLSDEKPTTEISKVPISSGKGAIGGTIVDPIDAVIPNATVTATNLSSEEVFTVKSNENGEFLLANLPSGKYNVTAEMPGFQTWRISNVVVSSMNLVKLKITLEVGTVSATVDVSSESAVTIDQSSSSIRNSVSRNEAKSIAGFFENEQNAPGFTPRVREYFPETLVWMPEIITDKNGKAEIKFRLGDNLTTWRLYAVGSTANGEIGLVEREFQTFQPFFAELDPPRILTESDEIVLSVPIRNYTNKRQKVAVSLAANNWSRILNNASQNIEIPANSTQNAVFNFLATTPVTDGKQRVTALANKEGDAIDKTVSVRPNGKEIVETQSALFSKETAFEVNFPENALPNNRRTEIKIYPNMLAHVAESVEGLLKRPYGCGEQTTSSTYPNLMILKLAKDKKNATSPIEEQAKIFLEDGYKRLLNYQTNSGFGYWNGNSPDVALTAYVLRFLSDAEDFIEVDETVVEKAEKWLLSQQKSDGSWQNSALITAYVARSLSLTAADDADKKRALSAAIEFLKKSADKGEDSYILANLALISNEIGDAETEQKAIEKLEKLAQTEKTFLQFWTTQNTPFYGWGTTAKIETTALVVQAFLKYKPTTPDLRFQSYIARGLRFLLENKDRYGVWYSTQTTVNVLNTLILLESQREKSDSEKAEIFINGAKVQEISLEANGLSKPFIFDASTLLTQNNRIEIKGLNNLAMAQIVSSHYIAWSDFQPDSRYFDFQINFDKLQAKISEEITGTVKIEKKFVHNGMLLAEIGLPPGADVLRETLENLKTEGKISNYDVLPDRIVIYFWGQNKPLEFSFKFRPRFGLNAQTAPSIVYDYYNEEAETMIAPLKFTVK